MALRLSSSFRLQPILRDGARVPVGSTCVIIFRNKSKAAKTITKKARKDKERYVGPIIILQSSLPLLLSRVLFCPRRELIRMKFKEEEIRKRMEQAMLKVAKRGEPLDPEMLNPGRKRPPVEVSP